MHGIRALVASTASAASVACVACGEGATAASFLEAPDATEVAEGGLAPVADAGFEDAADASPPTPKPDYDASDEPVVCASAPCVTQLAAGDRHVCALLSEGSVRCWGDDNKGQLGRGENAGSASEWAKPAPVVDFMNVTQISAAGDVTCARDAEGHVHCWGDNAQGQLGLQVSPVLADPGRHTTPAAVALAPDIDIARVDVGPWSACAVAANGDVYCWGANNMQQLARPDAGTTGAPDRADIGEHEIVRIGAGLSSVFGVTKDGQLVGWGGVSGRASSLPSTPEAAPLPGLNGVASVAAQGELLSSGHACAIAGGHVYCWGRAAYGEHGLGIPNSTGNLPVPAVRVLVDGAAFPQQIAVGAGISCVRMTDGTIECCGNDTRGALGRGAPSAGAPPPSVFARATASDEYAVQVTVTSRGVCALTKGGKVVCWGGNDEGELGQGTKDIQPHSTPLTVVFE